MNAQMQQMAKPSPGSSVIPVQAGQLQRKKSGEHEPSYVPPIVHEVLNSQGQPLDNETRAFMEPRFGHDFSRVRVHTDSRAAESAWAVNALAYTVGRDVVFGTRQYAPATSHGLKLLAHELTHTLQQSESISQKPEKMIISSLESAAEQEAWDKSSDIMQGLPSSPAIKSGIQVSRVDAGYPASAGVPAPQSAPKPPVLTTARQGGVGNTFVSTDNITFTVQVTGIQDAGIASIAGGAIDAGKAAVAGVATDAGIAIDAGISANQVAWTVQSVSPNSGNGNPHTATGQNFAFTPNPTNRPTTGSRTPNDPIRYRIEAQLSGATATLNLEQDEADIIRQEYIDVGPTVPPARGEIMAPAIATFNTGNYGLIVDRGMNNALTSTQNQFQTLTQLAAAPPAGSAPPAAGAIPPPVPVPAITAVSGYRNPRRNIAIGSNFPVTSRHVWGSALDLVVAGANPTLWARLREAGASAGTGICEDGPTQKPCNDPTIDHVHIQW